MWLITPVGFFSIVQKPTDQQAGTLTVRARVRGDLEALREHFLPGLGDMSESPGNDYRFRAVAPRDEVAAALGSMIQGLDYSNFKSEVARVQGTGRAHLYHQVWDVLHKLQVEGKKQAPVGPTYHPRHDENGKLVEIRSPSRATSLETWHEPTAIARVIPGGPMPKVVSGVAVKSWADFPKTAKGWEELAASSCVDEPAFQVPAGYRKAAGVVLREPDGRVWVVAPSNGYAGYKATFPKGTMDGKSAQATAMTEAFEESGLQVRLLRHLTDVKRTQSYTRYFLAERIGGDPADMGWESQAVMLVPIGQLRQVLNSQYDIPVIEAVKNA
ncbi:NUDIX hydrolase [Burkholderia sp. 4M9327F10]|uniref:NUDIX hydrolase n=1 Tax=Burkholderia sp. 4M9327F10 TaxID=2502223 RepID=UPI002016F445|nr:NUDIX hydrolase [Burkholderia sp. 4M9327F10]